MDPQHLHSALCLDLGLWRALLFVYSQDSNWPWCLVKFPSGALWRSEPRPRRGRWSLRLLWPLHAGAAPLYSRLQIYCLMDISWKTTFSFQISRYIKGSRYTQYYLVAKSNYPNFVFVWMHMQIKMPIKNFANAQYLVVCLRQQNIILEL